jgi:hypothetical protein
VIPQKIQLTNIKKKSLKKKFFSLDFEKKIYRCSICPVKPVSSEVLEKKVAK